MHAEGTQRVKSTESLSQGSFSEEFRKFWDALPEKPFFFGLLAAWFVLFQFFGNCQFNFTSAPSLFQWLWAAWGVESLDSSHGKLIPFVVLGILWYKREELLASMKGFWWPALALVLLAVLIHVAGYAIQEARVSVIGLFLGLYGLVGLAWGWKTLKASFFPFVLFVFCMPLGTFIEALSFKLRILATIITAFITRDLMGIPLVRDGTQLLDANGTFNYDVGTACSGIRSLFALLAITIVFGMLLYKSYWRRAIMISFAIPLAIFCNTLRLIAIVVGAQAFGPAAGSFVHEWFGFVTYAISIGGVMLLARFLRETPPVMTKTVESDAKLNAISGPAL